MSGFSTAPVRISANDLPNADLTKLGMRMLSAEEGALVERAMAAYHQIQVGQARGLVGLTFRELRRYLGATAARLLWLLSPGGPVRLSAPVAATRIRLGHALRELRVSTSAVKRARRKLREAGLLVTSASAEHPVGRWGAAAAACRSRAVRASFCTAETPLDRLLNLDAVSLLVPADAWAAWAAKTRPLGRPKRAVFHRAGGKDAPMTRPLGKPEAFQPPPDLMGASFAYNISLKYVVGVVPENPSGSPNPEIESAAAPRSSIFQNPEPEADTARAGWLLEVSRMPAVAKLPDRPSPNEPMDKTEPPLSRVLRMVRAYQDAVLKLYGVQVFRRVTSGSPTYRLLHQGMTLLTELRVAPEPWALHVLTEFRAYHDRADTAPLPVRASSLAFSAAPPPLNVVFAPGCIKKRLDRYRERVGQYIIEPVVLPRVELETALRDTERKLRAGRPGVNVLRMSLFPGWYRELRAAEIAGVACVAG